MSVKLVNVEGQLCGVLVVLLFVLVPVSITLISWPLFLTLSLPSVSAVCQVNKVFQLTGVTNCSEKWHSCQDSCSSPAVQCVQVYVQYWLRDNTTSIIPLFANVLGCGFDFGLTCSEFVDRFVISVNTFNCNIYSNPDYALPNENTRLELLKYFTISLVPLLALIICCSYMIKRNMFILGYKKAKKFVKKKPKGPKSFYQRKVLELEFKKNLRLLKMKNTQNDVKVFDLEHSQTTGALVLKPRFFISQAQPPRIIV